jgi:hypothetical protein
MKMKSEIKVEFNNKEILNHLIQKAYFDEGQKGRLSGQRNFIELTPEIDDILHTIVKGLHNATIKITNQDLIDGTFRFIIEDENDTIKLFPISMFCVIDENKKYSFY